MFLHRIDYQECINNFAYELSGIGSYSDNTSRCQRMSSQIQGDTDQSELQLHIVFQFNSIALFQTQQYNMHTSST